LDTETDGQTELPSCGTKLSLLCKRVLYPRSVFEGEIVKAGGRQVEHDTVVKDDTATTEFHLPGTS